MVRAKYDVITNDIPDPIDEDGLTISEREFLKAPFSQLNPDQRMTAMAIKEKQVRNRWAANDEYRRKQQEKTGKRFS